MKNKNKNKNKNKFKFNVWEHHPQLATHKELSNIIDPRTSYDGKEFNDAIKRSAYFETMNRLESIETDLKVAKNVSFKKGFIIGFIIGLIISIPIIYLITKIIKIIEI